jgi:hypothetical protein
MVGRRAVGHRPPDNLDWKKLMCSGWGGNLWSRPSRLQEQHQMESGTTHDSGERNRSSPDLIRAGMHDSTRPARCRRVRRCCRTREMQHNGSLGGRRYGVRHRLDGRRAVTGGRHGARPPERGIARSRQREQRKAATCRRNEARLAA